MMKTFKILAIIFLSILIVNCSDIKKEDLIKNENATSTLAKEIKTKELSLFERLGGETGIASIVDMILDTHIKNPKLKDIFLPLKENPEHFEMIKKHSREFLAAGTGGFVKYTGKDLPTAHKGLQTTEKQYILVVDDILFVLDAHHIDEETKKDMLYILYLLKDQVIGK